MKSNLEKKPRPPRHDEHGRAFRGSQLHMQVWVNCHRDELTRRTVEALGITTGTSLHWKSPVPPKFSEYRDGSFLRALDLQEHRDKLKAFWPKGGPVWDGLAVEKSRDGSTRTVILVEAKSYPREVSGSGCLATTGSAARISIEDSLDRTAAWLGIARPNSWTGKLYQSANRLAHLFFLRETVGINAFMMNVCFENDPRRPTSASTWEIAIKDFRNELGIAKIATPWLADIVVPAGDRAELLAVAI